MKELLFALIAGGLGVMLLLFGYRLARILIPLWGFFAGFTIGAAAGADAFGATFVGTTTGIVIGLVVGIVFAVLAYFFYALAIVLIGATVGYWIGAGFVELVGINAGFISAFTGIAIGAVLGIACMVGNVPKYFLIFITALGGSAAICSSVLILINGFNADKFSYTTASQSIVNSWLWLSLIIILTVLSIVFQVRQNRGYYLAAWDNEEIKPVSSIN